WKHLSHRGHLRFEPFCNQLPVACYRACGLEMVKRLSKNGRGIIPRPYILCHSRLYIIAHGVGIQYILKKGLILAIFFEKFLAEHRVGLEDRTKIIKFKCRSAFYKLGDIMQFTERNPV